MKPLVYSTGSLDKLFFSILTYVLFIVVLLCN